MATKNGRQYTSFRGVELTAENGVLRFNTPSSVPSSTAGEYLLYVDSSGNLVYDNGSGPANVGGVDAVETVAATNAIGAGESGKVFFLSHATEFVSTLPAPAAGLRFTFFVAAAPSSASYTIVTHNGTDLIHGVAASSADAGGSVDSTAGTAAATITFVDGQAKVGDYIQLWCDGTSWFAVGMCSDEDAITFTPAS